MSEELVDILGSIDADYADIRYEVKRETTISFSGTELSQIGSNTTDGYVLRVLKNGGVTSVTFTRPDDATKAMQAALENASIAAKHRDKPVWFADAPPVQDTFKAPLVEDPRVVPLEEKLEVVREYCIIPAGYGRIVTSNLTYRELIREKHFASSQGSRIGEDLVTTALSGEIVAGDGTVMQNVRVAAGGSDGFQNVRNQHDYVEARTAIAMRLLDAEPVSGGTYNCVLNQSMGGVFVHEAFGHYSEADIVERIASMRSRMTIGAELGDQAISITDDATRPGQLGFYRYDDEGIPVRTTRLMKDGILTGRLHSRRTAAEFSEPVSGHCVAEDYRYPPIIRMGTIFMEPGPYSFDELTALVDNGLYVLDAKGGATSGENFTFGAQYGYRIKNGKVGPMVRDINVSGNLYQTLKDITAVGNDLELSKLGGCGKMQMNRRSCSGSPHIVVKNLVVGGV